MLTVVILAQLTWYTMSRMVPKHAESVRKKVNNASILAIYLFNSQLYCKLPIYVCMLHRKSLNDHNFGIFHPILTNEGIKMIY